MHAFTQPVHHGIGARRLTSLASAHDSPAALSDEAVMDRVCCKCCAGFSPLLHQASLMQPPRRAACMFSAPILQRQANSVALPGHSTSCANLVLSLDLRHSAVYAATAAGICPPAAPCSNCCGAAASFCACSPPSRSICCCSFLPWGVHLPRTCAATWGACRPPRRIPWA